MTINLQGCWAKPGNKNRLKFRQTPLFSTSLNIKKFKSQPKADLRIRPEERFSTQGDFPLYAPLSISRPAKSREEFVDTMEKNLLYDGFNLFILLPVALWLGAPTKANQQKLARMIGKRVYYKFG